MSIANSSARAVIFSYAARSSSPRSRGAVRAQSACAATAASSAARPSATEAAATWVSTRPVDGSSTAMVSPPLPSRHCPPMSRPLGTASITDFCVTAAMPETLFLSWWSSSRSPWPDAAAQRSSMPHGEP